MFELSKDKLELYTTMISDCEKRESRISEWEQNFIDSISNQIGNTNSLSNRQIEILNEIWEKATRDG